MTIDTKAVARFNFDAYHGCEFEAYDGYFVQFTDHERVVKELRAELEALNEAHAVGDGTVSGSLLHWHQRALAAESALAASRADVEGLKKDAERWNWIMQGHYGNEPARANRVIGACWSRKAMEDAIDNDIATQAAMEKGNV